jgi:hypothetical protein
MKNQKKNSEKKSTENAKWITPKEAAQKLGVSFNPENLYSEKNYKSKEKNDN